MIRRPPRSTQSRSSAASDVYKRQVVALHEVEGAVKAAVCAVAVTALELETTDAAAPVLAHEVGGRLFGTVVGVHREIPRVGHGVADAAQRGAQRRHPVAREDDDALSLIHIS